MSLLESINPQGIFLFQTFDDSPAKQQQLAKQFYGTLEEWQNRLIDLNKSGAGIYFTVNKTRGKHRKASDILAARALWIDVDNDQVKLPGLAPSFKVHTSPGKYHAYWVLKQPQVDMDKWDELQKSLINVTNSDPNVGDRPRVLRVPGFDHMKDYHDPHPVVEEETGPLYSWDILYKEFMQAPQSASNDLLPDNTNSLDRAVHDIITGKNYNDSLGTLSQTLANKQHSEFFIQVVLQGIMEQAQEKDARWQARMNHLPLQIKTALKKADEVEFKPKKRSELETLGIRQTEFPMPPGRLGAIAENVMSFMKYPDATIATVTALHVVSTFAGRRFSFEGKGLTARRILLAPQGTGKNTTNKYMQAIVKALQMPPEDSNMPRLIDADKFITAGDYTSPKMLHYELEEFASRSMILAEAGQAGKSDAGDMGRLKAYVLQLLSTNYGEGQIPTKYSLKQNEQLQKIYDFCAVMLHESVPDNYTEVLTSAGAFVSGELARSDLIYVEVAREAKKNRNFFKAAVDIPTLDFLADLAHTAVKNIPVEGTVPLSQDNIIYAEYESEELAAEVDKLDDEIDIKIDSSTNELERSLLVRRMERFKITVLILAIADWNLSDEGQLPSQDACSVPTVTKDHVTWVNQYQDALEATVRAMASGGDFADPSDAAIQSINEKLTKILGAPTKSYFSQGNTKEMAKYNCITRGTLTRMLSHNKFIDKYAKNICFGNRSRAMNDLLKEMEVRGDIKVYGRYARETRPDYLHGVNGEVIQYLYDVS